MIKILPTDWMIIVVSSYWIVNDVPVDWMIKAVATFWMILVVFFN